jgi:NOL1/NOP2/fmu family ribosome biogenesis protein
MSRKLSLSSAAIIAALKADPKAKPLALAKEHGVAASYVYKLRKKLTEGKRKVTLTKDQVEIAKKLGVSLEDYVKEGLKMGALKYDGERPIVNPTITMEPSDVDAVLDSRAKDYGKFIEGAEIMQMLKRLVHNYIEDRGTPLAFDQREAIDMIIHKLGRIINGNPDKVDHWVDIAGYATLVAERLEGNAR